jgi:hypothetical protein
VISSIAGEAYAVANGERLLIGGSWSRASLGDRVCLALAWSFDGVASTVGPSLGSGET